jgi:predicted DCC family thiol-disulfide oxidoreductase YuxK
VSASKPVLLYDGDCGFCRLWVERWRRDCGGRAEFLPSQGARGRFPALAPEDLTEAVHLVEPGGRTSRGAEAVFRVLALQGGARRAWLALYEAVPLFRAASEAAYRLVARRRPLFSRLTKLLWGSPVPAPVEGARRVLLGGLGLCYLVAFVSLAVQFRGLVGAGGLEPAARYLDAAARALGGARFYDVPTLAWLSSSDRALAALCWGGALASLGLLLDVAPGPAALACWVFYLSLSAVGGDFLGFQWDALLLEAGLVAVFLAPWAARRRDRTPAPRAAWWLMRLLLFKLMLQSGLVKLLSGDPSWRNLTALTYHYWTQPLPTPLAWEMNRLPLWFQKLSCAGMFGVELGAPWLLLGPRRVRRLGAGLVAALMTVITLTGSYGFFNLLTLVLCVSALDDAHPLLARLSPQDAGTPRASRPAAAFAALWLAVSGAAWLVQTGRRPPLAPVSMALLRASGPFRSINSYGLFAVMTTTRDEISVEVSADGHDWKEWPFRWKPGDPARAPRVPGLYMPRLDWQMWFAALGAPSSWFNNLLFRLLQGSPQVEALMGPSPLGRTKPAFARAWLWETRFSTPAERRATGHWWVREKKGLYFPVVSLRGSL